MGKCACIVNRQFDFILEPNGCNELRYQDMSKWEEGPNYEKPVSYEINISTAGAGRNVQVKTDGVTGISAEQIGYGGGPIPDVLICIKVETCDDSYIRYRYLTCKVQCCLDQYVRQLREKNARDSEYVEVDRLQQLLLIVKSAAETGDIQFAQEAYEEVKNAVEEMFCDCKCK